MKILHTADLHIGRGFNNISRHEEFEQLFDWFISIINTQNIDVVLIAGDVFDTSTPSNRSLELYYKFLADISQKSQCRHVVIIGGNHDSAAVLSSAGQLLKSLNIHIVGGYSNHTEDEIIVLKDNQDTPELIVCAVPFLKERDVRKAGALESSTDKHRKVIEGIAEHYQQIFHRARTLQYSLKSVVPIVAMGHLYMASSENYEGDGVREIYVGSLSQITPDIFPQWLSYVALGHLHIPHSVGNNPTIRYSGSPLPLGFHEAHYPKSVPIIELGSDQTQIELLDIPSFKRLVSVKGDWHSISGELLELTAANEAMWVEVIYIGKEILPDLRQRVFAIVDNSQLQLLRIDDRTLKASRKISLNSEKTLDQISPQDVFDQYLAEHPIEEEYYDIVKSSYNLLVEQIQAEEKERSDNNFLEEIR